MFNSTHALVGFALSRSGLDRLAPYAGWTAVIASNLPDIDIATQLGGTARYLDHHRGITHSIIAIPVLSLILAIVMQRISDKWGQVRVGLLRHFTIALLAMATHPLLDFANNYGVRPFLPFSDTWYYGDTLFIIDPYLDLILLVGVVAGFRWRHHARISAHITLVLALLYVGARLELRNIAISHLANRTPNMSGFIRSAVLPQMLSPFKWTGFVETQEQIATTLIEVPGGSVTPMNGFRNTPESPIIAAAKSTYSGRVFEGFARFPIVRVQELDSGYRVWLVDVRFFRAGIGTGLAAEILLDRSLNVESESMSFVANVPLL